jgi:hypothetical protein
MDEEGAGIDVIEAFQQGYYRSFPTARRADNSDFLAAKNLEVDTAEDLLRPGGIGEADVSKLDGNVGLIRGGLGACRGVDGWSRSPQINDVVGCGMSLGCIWTTPNGQNLSEARSRGTQRYSE